LSWPACGEIDIMEHWGSNQNFVQSAMHTPSSFGNTVNHGGQVIPTVSTQFHDYELVWTDDQMIFSVDGVVHYVYNPPVKNAQTWPFEWEHYMLLNIAIQPSIAANFTESAMEIDYVRVYQETPLNAPEFRKNAVRVFPNPAQQEIQVTFDEEVHSRTVELYSLLGQKVLEEKAANVRNIIDIQHLKPGVYLLKTAQQTIKIVKE